MRLITYGHREDFGHDWYIQLLHSKRWAALQVSVSWSDFTSWPYLQLRFGGGSLFDIYLMVYKFGLCIDLFSRMWSYGLVDKALEDDDD